MKRLLVSACLLGEHVRYDGDENSAHVRHLNDALQRWQAEGRIVPVCPEVMGGLPVPRIPAETTSGGGEGVLKGKSRVINQQGDDVTEAFIAGAQRTLEIAQKQQANLALLAARSPSCGTGLIYDGTFTRKLTAGNGVTVALLTQHGVKCFTPDQADDLIRVMDHVLN